MQWQYRTIEFSRHAVEQMFSRSILAEDVKKAINNGEVIKSYVDDKPYPSYLILHYIKERPLHVVIAYDSETKSMIVITAYEPSPILWENDFKNRR